MFGSKDEISVGGKNAVIMDTIFQFSFLSRVLWGGGRVGEVCGLTEILRWFRLSSAAYP